MPRTHLKFGDVNCTVAPMWRRIVAALIDIIICWGLVFVPLINFVLMLGYGFCRDSWKYFGGQSIGKRMMHIRVMNRFTRHDINEDYSTGITRNLTLLFFGLDLLVPLLNKNRERIGDKNARTIVLIDSQALKRYNANAIRNKKRFVKLYDDYDSHGMHNSAHDDIKKT